MREETGDAVSHYADRVKDTIKDAGESIGSAGQQLADWLKQAGTSEDDVNDDDTA